jgi:prevent-host-death family protein
MPTTITSTEFQRNVGTHVDQALRDPIFITKHSRESLVLVAAEDYRRLKELDTRRALYPHELDDETLADMDKGYQGASTPHLDHLLD